MTSDPFQRRGPDPTSRNMHSFSTERLRMDLPTPADALPLYELVGGSDRDVIAAPLIWDGPDDVAAVEDWVERCRTETFEDFGFHWVIRDASGGLCGVPGRPIGAIGTRPLGAAGRADVGYWLGVPYWGRGAMSEALTALLRFGFETLEYAKVEAEVFLDNERGRRLVESVGMTREAVIRRAHRKRGRWVDVAVYGMLAEELDPDE